MKPTLTLFQTTIAVLCAVLVPPAVHAQRGGGGMGMTAQLPPMTGTWERNAQTRFGGQLTEYGRSLREGLAIFDDPLFYCEGYNVVRSTNIPSNPVKIEEYPDRLIIYFEGNAAERHIFLDGETPSANLRTIGTSIGRRLPDGTIEIRTDGFPDMLVHGVRPGAITTTDEMKFLERYRISEDGQTIESFQMTTDPRVLEYPRVAMGTWNRVSDDGYWFANECVIHEDEITYTDELRERGLEILRGE